MVLPAVLSMAQADLQVLCEEAGARKRPEVAESAKVALRGLKDVDAGSLGSEEDADVRQQELLVPFLQVLSPPPGAAGMAGALDPKLVIVALDSLSRLLAHRAVPGRSLAAIVGALDGAGKLGVPCPA